MAVTLHHLSDSQSIRVLFALEEFSIPYSLKVYSRVKGRAPPELKELFPLGKSPILEIPATDNSNESAPRKHISANPNPATDRTVVTESRLILHHLADHYAPSLKTRAEDAARNAYFEDFAMCTLGPLMERILIFDLIPQLTPFIFRPVTWSIFHPFVWLFKKELDGPLSVMEDALGEKEWFGGRALGIADFCMIFPMDVAEQRGWFTFTFASGESKYPRVTRWLERTRGRESYQRAVGKSEYDLRAFGYHG